MRSQKLKISYLEFRRNYKGKGFNKTYYFTSFDYVCNTHWCIIPKLCFDFQCFYKSFFVSLNWVWGKHTANKIEKPTFKSMFITKLNLAESGNITTLLFSILFFYIFKKDSSTHFLTNSHFCYNYIL